MTTSSTESRPGHWVHNHAPYRPVCNERVLPGGQRRGACVNDDGTDRAASPATDSGTA